MVGGSDTCIYPTIRANAVRSACKVATFQNTPLQNGNIFNIIFSVCTHIH